MSGSVRDKPLPGLVEEGRRAVRLLCERHVRPRVDFSLQRIGKKPQYGDRVDRTCQSRGTRIGKGLSPGLGDEVHRRATGFDRSGQIRHITAADENRGGALQLLFRLFRAAGASRRNDREMKFGPYSPGVFLSPPG